MKKVWILEKFETHEEMLNHLECFKEYHAGDEHGNMLIESYAKVIEQNPDGRWIGFDGKTNYKSFCEVARGSIRRNPKSKFRVIEAEIQDDAKSWFGYKMVKENEGVLRYLMATK